MINFNKNYFKKNKKQLIWIANKWYLKWLLGLNRLPKDLKNKKILDITPNSITYTKKNKKTIAFFTRPRFAEALAFNLSPFAYLKNNTQTKFHWKFSPVGVVSMLLMVFSGHPIFLGTTNTYYSSSGDGYVKSNDFDWATVKAGKNEQVDLTCAEVNDFRLSDWYGDRTIYRAGFVFDTSEIGATSTINSAILNLYCSGITAGGFSSHNGWVATKSDLSGSSDAIAWDNYSNALNTASNEVRLSTTDGYNSFTITSLALINKTTNTNLGIVSWFDINDTDPNESPKKNDYGTMHFSEETGTSNDPYLEVAIQATDVKNDTNLSTSLVSYWELEESSGTRYDSHGSNNLADNNTVGQGTGKQGYCADFEKSNTERLSIGDNSQSGLDLSTDFSFAAWIKLESIDNTAQIISKWDSVPGYNFYIESSDNKLYIDYSKNQYSANSNITLIKANTAFTSSDIGIWKHVVVTVDISVPSATFYINGVDVGSTIIESNATSIYNNGENFYIGDGFDGLIDEVGIWSKILTSTEVLDLYNSGSGIPYDAGGSSLSPSISSSISPSASLSSSISASQSPSASLSPSISSSISPSASLSPSISCSISPSASSDFSDNFNRADSDTVGNGWSEIDIGSDVGIVSNRLQFPYSGTDVDAGVIHRDISTWGYNNITLEFAYRKDSAATNTTEVNQITVQHDGSTRGTGMGIHLSISVGNNTISSSDGATQKGSGTYSLTTDTTYYIRWDINSDNSQRLYIRENNSCFEAGDLLFSVSSFTASVSDTRLGIGARFYAQYDYIELYSPVKTDVLGSISSSISSSQSPSSSLSPSSSISPSISSSISPSLSPSLSASISPSLSASISSSASLSPSLSASLSASISPSISASQSPSASLSPSISSSISSSLSPSLSASISPSLSSSISFSLSPSLSASISSSISPSISPSLGILESLLIKPRIQTIKLNKKPRIINFKK